jgi:hypothetical protein
MDQLPNEPANPQTSNPLDNFGTKRHVFTREDAIKGGLAKSEQKTAANRLQPLKTGKYSKRIPKCNSCEKKGFCIFYKEGSGCQVQIAVIKQIHEIHTGGPEEVFKLLNTVLQHHLVQALSSGDGKAWKDAYEMLLKYKEARYGTQATLYSMDLSTFMAKLHQERENEYQK